MANKKNFIKSAIKRPGSLTAAAKKAGKSIGQFCSSGNLSTRMKQKCNLYNNVLKKGK